jgi:uncharacterized 2Fe-2S/4Fe-4S cluster protein (DUF4445 family)
VTKVEISFLPQNRTVQALPGADLLTVARQAHIEIESSCNGLGTCGKCQVQRIDGDPGIPHEDEVGRLTAEELDRGIRLACRQKVVEDATFRVARSAGKKHRILSDGVMPSLKLDPQIRKVHVALPSKSFEDAADDLTRLERALGRSLAGKLPLSLLREIPALFREKGSSLTAVLADGELIGLEPGDTARCCYGVAVDIGTTTIVVSLVDLTTGEELAAASCINPQKTYGLDVLTRIQYVQDNSVGLEHLSSLVREAIDSLMGEACAEACVERRHIYEITVAANTTMLHLLLGVDPTGIGKSPYTPAFTRGLTIPARELQLECASFGEVYCLPSVSSFIGADIVAGVVCAELEHKDERALFIDIGTNGEIVFSSPDGIFACSCAAGPALEGMNISCGVRAADGAIDRVSIAGDVEIHTIGDKPATGLCGTGVIDAVGELLRVGALAPSGRFVKLMPGNGPAWADRLRNGNGPASFVLGSGKGPDAIKVTQKDIRQVQLAKGAILSGILVLLRQLNINFDQIGRVYVAGAFGFHVRLESLARIGLLPEELIPRVSLIGNTSKSGAIACLLAREKREDASRIAPSINYVELSCYPDFDRLFTQCLPFPPGSGEASPGDATKINL